MCADWDELYDGGNGGGDSVPSMEEIKGKSFGKGRGFTPHVADNQSSWGSDDRRRGGGGNRGGRGRRGGGGSRFRNDDSGENDPRGGGRFRNNDSGEERRNNWNRNNDNQNNDDWKNNDNGWGNNTESDSNSRGWSDGDRDGNRRGRGGGRGGGGRGGDRDNDRNGDDREEKKDRPPIYVPQEISEEELNETGYSVGINFKDYANIKVNITGENPPEPIETFAEANLRPLLLDNLMSLKYSEPTPVQKFAIPTILEGRDLMATAQTGSGKTAAFLLPIIHRILENSNELSEPLDCQCEPKAVILSPTRELTTQIYLESRKFCRSSMIKCAQIYGGTSVSFQSKGMTGAHILVATPGRLGDYLKKGALGFSKIRFVVLDEADRMLDMGFKGDIDTFFNHESMVSASERQTLMFSATFDQDIQRLAQNYLNNYIFLAVGIVGGACKDVEQVFIQAERRDKQRKLVELLRQESDTKGTLIFVETKRNADFLATYLSEQDFPTTSIHGDREQRQREEALREFRSGKRDILVATSVAARGLDIKGVKHVINYDLPKHVEDYVHRIGRTGRLGNKGKATSFYLSEQDQAIASTLVQILEQAGQSVPTWLQGDAAGGSSYRDNEFGGTDYRSNNNNFRTDSRNQPQELAMEENW